MLPDLQLLTAGETSPQRKITVKKLVWDASQRETQWPSRTRITMSSERQRSLGTGRLWGSFLAEDTRISLPQASLLVRLKHSCCLWITPGNRPCNIPDTKARALVWLLIGGGGSGERAPDGQSGDAGFCALVYVSARWGREIQALFLSRWTAWAARGWPQARSPDFPLWAPPRKSVMLVGIQEGRPGRHWEMPSEFRRAREARMLMGQISNTSQLTLHFFFPEGFDKMKKSCSYNIYKS